MISSCKNTFKFFEKERSVRYLPDIGECQGPVLFHTLDETTHWDSGYISDVFWEIGWITRHGNSPDVSLQPSWPVGWLHRLIWSSFPPYRSVLLPSPSLLEFQIVKIYQTFHESKLQKSPYGFDTGFKENFKPRYQSVK